MADRTQTPQAATTPIVWALTGARTGDNTQVLHLAEALGYEVREVALAYGASRMLPNWLLGATTATLDAPSRARLVPPWPDLVVGAGQRSVPVARWIRARSGGRTKMVFLGRPRAPLNWFDLVVTTPQYGLPAGDRVMTVGLPFVASLPAPEDADDWLAQWAALDRPLTAVLVGASHYPYRIDATSLARLTRQARQVAGGGGIVYSTSPRTTQREADLLQAAAGTGATVLRWSRGAANPHRALLAHADRFVVTEDSVSMIAEACATDRPVHVAPLTRRPAIAWRADSGVACRLAEAGVLSPPRDVRRLVRMLAASGRIEVPGIAADAQTPHVLSSWDDVIARVRAMLVGIPGRPEETR